MAKKDVKTYKHKEFDLTIEVEVNNTGDYVNFDTDHGNVKVEPGGLIAVDQYGVKTSLAHEDLDKFFDEVK